MEKNKFAGADDIWITKKNKIAVKRIYTYLDKFGSFHHNEVTKYYKPTKSNINAVKRIYGSLNKN